MIRDFLIDGYNLMHAAGLARPTYGPGDLERCRQRLLVLLAGSLGEQQRRRTTVVFDAKEAVGERMREFTVRDMRVLFTDPGHEADELIESLLAVHSSPKRLLVVSSDHRLHKAARRRRAKVQDSDQFLDHLERQLDRALQRAHDRDDRGKPDGPLSPAEVEQWLKVFGDVREELRIEPSPEVPAAVPSPQPDIATPLQPPSEVIEASELEFWEQRLADLLRKKP
jgi:predicted RNA-binding protein with PIN domain